MVDRGGEFADANTGTDLLRAYADRLMEQSQAHPREIGRTRSAFLARRKTLRGSRVPPPSVRTWTSAAWLAAFFQGDTPRTVLERGLADLEAAAPTETMDVHRRLVEHHASWVEARADRSLDKGLLEEVAAEFGVGRRRDDVAPQDLRRSALRARTRHPGLVALCPQVFDGLLRPRFLDVETVIRRPSRAALRRSRERVRRERHKGGSTPWFWYVLLAVMVSNGIRRCSARTTPDHEIPRWKPPVIEQPWGEGEQRRYDERLRRLLEDDPDRSRPDRARPDGR